MYRLDIKWTAKYGDINPSTGEPEIVVTRDPDHPGTYIYSWTTHRKSMYSPEINGILREAWNNISTYEFNVYYGSECWDVFFPARTAVRLWSEKEQAYIFNGRVSDVTENMDSDGVLYKTILCENEMAYFCDSICDTADVLGRLEDYHRSMNARDVLVTVLELHHYNTGGIAATLSKGFAPPNSTWNDNTNSFDYPSNVYPTTAIDDAFASDVDTTWALIQDVFVDKLGMDIWITYDDSVVPEGGDPTWTFCYNVLHMARNGGGSVGDAITISTNMKSLRVETSPTANGRVTRIVPLGGIGANGRRLDVSSIPQYHEGWVEPSYEKAVSNEILSITYGHVDKVSLHEDLVDNGNKSESEVNAMIQELYRRGRAEADALTGGITSLSVQAVDLAEAGYTGAHKFKVGDYHRITNSFLNLDETFRLVSKVTNLAEPWNPELEFAKSQSSGTKYTAKRSTSTSSRIYNVENMISTRLDKSAVMLTTQSAYDLMTNRNANTVHYADQGDGTWKAYMGDEPIKFGDGGWEVDTAVILNNNNMADWEIDEELMANISAHDKLYYGGHQKMVVVQGHACRYANSALDDTDALKFGTKLEIDGWYRGAATDTYVQRHYVIEMYVNDISTSTSGGVTSDVYVFGLTVSRYVPNASTPENVRAFYTGGVTNPSDAFIVLRVNAMSFATEFTKAWSGTTQTASTPYGYVQCNNLTITIGALTEASPMAVTYPTIYPNGSSSSTTVYLNVNGSNAGNDQYRCVPLGGNAEKYFDMALSKRSEPTGGGNS